MFRLERGTHLETKKTITRRATAFTGRKRAQARRNNRGRNGAGKTTIMRMISGLSRPTRGGYSLFGETGLKMRRLLKNVGVLIEHPGLYPKLSAYENLKIKCIGMELMPDGMWAQASEDTGHGIMGIIGKLPKDEASLNKLVEEMNELNKLTDDAQKQ